MKSFLWFWSLFVVLLIFQLTKLTSHRMLARQCEEKGLEANWVQVPLTSFSESQLDSWQDYTEDMAGKKESKVEKIFIHFNPEGSKISAVRLCRCNSETSMVFHLNEIQTRVFVNRVIELSK